MRTMIPAALSLAIGLMTGCIIEQRTDGKSSTSDTANSQGSDPSDTAESILPMATERRVIHEVFTGSNCGPCLGADAILDEVFQTTNRQYSVIKYQVGSDPYMTTEGVRRRMYYLPGEASYAIPYVHADGIYAFHPAEINDEQGYDKETLKGFADIEAPLMLGVSHTITGQTVDFSIDWTILDDLSSEYLVVHAAIIENKTTGNVGSNGQTEFHQVMKKMVPDEEGTAIGSQRRGDEGSLELSYTFNGDYNPDTSYSDLVDHAAEHTVEEFEDLEVIVWVQDSLTWDVHQSAWTAQ